MDELLLLCHRIPYPPDKGDKIRAFHLLRFLAQRFTIHLGAFVDDPADWRHEAALRKLVQGELLLRPLNPRLAKLRSLRGLLTGTPLTVPYYRDAAMARWVAQCLAGGRIHHGVAFSSGVAQYLEPYPALRRVLDLVDVDSQKWRQYGERKRGAMGWVYRREGTRLLAYERRLAHSFDATLLVSAAEAGLLRALAPESAERVDCWENGVDATCFSPSHPYPNPYYAQEGPVLVFTGAMDYWPNVDAVVWFGQAVFPQVRQWLPDARLVVVGGNPHPAVQLLGRRPGITVTGRVPDVRPYIAHAHAAVAPLRIAQGVQNKVLEAMAMGKPVLATRKAMEGIHPCPGLERWVSDDPQTLAELAVTLLREGDGGSGARGRRCVLTHYDWERNLEHLLPWLRG